MLMKYTSILKNNKKAYNKIINYRNWGELFMMKNIFAPNGADIVSAVEAKVVITDTTAYDLEL